MNVFSYAYTYCVFFPSDAGRPEPSEKLRLWAQIAPETFVTRAPGRSHETGVRVVLETFSLYTYTRCTSCTYYYTETHRALSLRISLWGPIFIRLERREYKSQRIDLNFTVGINTRRGCTCTYTVYIILRNNNMFCRLRIVIALCNV